MGGVVETFRLFRLQSLVDCPCFYTYLYVYL